MAEVVSFDRQSKPLVEHALTYARAGVKVFATTANGKAPATSNKAWAQYLGREIVKGEGGLNMATTDEDTIRWMFSRPAAGGIGMPCGEVNDVIVLDLDTHKEDGGVGNANAIQREFWDEIEEAHSVETRNGGLHVYWSYQPGHRKKELGANIEVQSDGAYVLLPPSKGYKVRRKILREDWPLPPWRPTADEVKQAVLNSHSAAVPDHVVKMIELIREKKHWHDPVRDVVAYLVGCGWSDREILKFTFQWTWPGYDPRETFETVCIMIDGARQKGWGDQS